MNKVPDWDIHAGELIKDGEWTLLCRDKQTGDTIWFIEHEDGRLTFRNQSDVESTLIKNKILKDGTEGRAFGDYRMIGSVPDIIAEASGLNEAWMQKDKKFIKRFFNDGDNAAFRASRGKV